jgi:hypothetical protein
MILSLFSHMLTYFLSSKTKGDQNIQRVWKLKGPHRLNLIHQKIGDDIKYFLKIHREVKKDTGVEQVVKHLQLAGEGNTFELSQLEKRCKWLRKRDT